MLWKKRSDFETDYKSAIKNAQIQKISPKYYSKFQNFKDLISWHSNLDTRLLYPAL